MYRRLATGLLALVAVAATAEHDRGVTLFRDSGFEGGYQTFYDGDKIAELGAGTIGNDTVSSVRIDPGCRVTLYKDVDFRGESITLTEDVAQLSYTHIGNDSVSSLKVKCRGGRRGTRRPGYYDPGYGDEHGHRPGDYEDRPDRSDEPDRWDEGHGYGHGYDWGGRPGVVLYSDSGFEGRQELFYADDPTLEDNLIRQDSASSIRVAPGCSAVVYEHSHYRGDAVLVSEDLPSLKGTRIGNDRISSIEVRCENRSYGVTLYEDVGYEGRSETFLGDDPQLRDNVVRQDKVSAVRVAPGCVVTLYEHPDYRGRSTTLRQDTPDLRLAWVGNDTVSSIRVDCRRSRYH